MRTSTTFLVLATFVAGALAFANTAKDKVVEFECVDANGIRAVGQIMEYHWVRSHFEGDFYGYIHIIDRQMVAPWYYSHGEKIMDGNLSVWRFLDDWEQKQIEASLYASHRKLEVRVPRLYDGDCTIDL